MRNVSQIYLGYNKWVSVLDTFKTPQTSPFKSQSFDIDAVDSSTPLHRIHTIEGYAFAGSEHISMLVINDNDRYFQVSHWITWITRWSTTTRSRLSTPSPSPGSSTSSSSSSPPVSNICTWWTSKLWDHKNIFSHIQIMIEPGCRMHSMGWSRWSIWSWTSWTSTTPSLTLSGDFRQLIWTQPSWSLDQNTKVLGASRICVFQNCQKLSIDNSDLGTVQPKATAGMINVDELRVVNSKVVTCRIIFSRLWLTLRIWGWSNSRWTRCWTAWVRKTPNWRCPPSSDLQNIQNYTKTLIQVHSKLKIIRKLVTQVLSVEGNHLLALPDDFDVQVAPS